MGFALARECKVPVARAAHRRPVRFFACIALLASACSRNTPAGSASAGPDAGPSATPVASALQNAPLRIGSVPTVPSDALDVFAAARRTREDDGKPIAVIAYLWLHKPNCPPCPMGAHCELCPPPFLQLSAHPHTGSLGDEHPGQVLLAEAEVERLVTTKLYVFRGVLGSAPGAGPEPVLKVSAVDEIEKQPPLFSRTCTRDEDCAPVVRRAIGENACCPTCGRVAATRAYVEAVEAYCGSGAGRECPRMAACRNPTVACVNRQCNATEP
jgi:hypothetical protein